MTPAELYALPSKSTDDWYRTYDDTWSHLFGLTPEVQSYDDIPGGGETGSDRLLVHTKMECQIDGYERSAVIKVVTFDGTPFAIVATAGRGQSDFDDTLISDQVVFEDALKFFVEKAMCSRHNKPLLVDPNDEPKLLKSFYGVTVVRTDAGFDMVRSEFVDQSGKLIFDLDKYLNDFHASRKEIDIGDLSISSPILSKLPDVRQKVAELIAGGVVGGDRVKVVNRRVTKGTGTGDWMAAAVATEAATYSIGLPSHQLGAIGFSWASSVTCKQIGGPELFDALKGTLVASISDGMKPR
jgi:hypothetical protein